MLLSRTDIKLADGLFFGSDPVPCPYCPYESVLLLGVHRFAATPSFTQRLRQYCSAACRDAAWRLSHRALCGISLSSLRKRCLEVLSLTNIICMWFVVCSVRARKYKTSAYVYCTVLTLILAGSFQQLQVASKCRCARGSHDAITGALPFLFASLGFVPVVVSSLCGP
jgi:hypothetical protein